jgi:hypothetical protein
MTEYMRAGFGESEDGVGGRSEETLPIVEWEPSGTRGEAPTRLQSSRWKSSRVSCSWRTRSDATGWNGQPCGTKQVGHEGCLG